MWLIIQGVLVVILEKQAFCIKSHIVKWLTYNCTAQSSKKPVNCMYDGWMET